MVTNEKKNSVITHINHQLFITLTQNRIERRWRKSIPHSNTNALFRMILFFNQTVFIYIFQNISYCQYWYKATPLPYTIIADM